MKEPLLESWAQIQYFCSKSSLFDIPNEVIKFEIKQILIRELNFEKGYFSKKLKINKFFYSSLEYILSTILNFESDVIRDMKDKGVIK